MLKDILIITDGEDLQVEQNEAPRAGNILSVQIGELDYNEDFGIDLRYFLQAQFAIQNDSFKGYCLQRLLDYQINVLNVVEVLDSLFITDTFVIGSSETTGSLIA